jgi:hypothetical protein
MMANQFEFMFSRIGMTMIFGQVARLGGNR